MIVGGPPWPPQRRNINSRNINKGVATVCHPYNLVSGSAGTLKILVLVVVYVVVNESRPVLVCLQLFAGLEANSLA